MNTPRPAPLLLVLMPFAAGIFFSRRLHGLSAADYCWLSALFFFCLLFFLWPFFSGTGEAGVPLNRKNVFALLLSLIFLFPLGIFHQKQAEKRLTDNTHILSDLAAAGGDYIFTGLVLKAPVPAARGCRTEVLVFAMKGPAPEGPVMEKLAVTFGGVSWHDLVPGSIIRFEARLREVRNFHTPGSFDYENWWALRGIRIKGYCSSSLKLVTVGADADAAPRYYAPALAVQKLRYRIMKAVSSFFQDQDTSAVATALLTGERAWFREHLRDGFAASGLGHLLAVSGLHMALVALFSAGLIRLGLGFSQWALLNLNVRVISYSSAVPACLFYTAIAGFSPSSLRAFFMVLALGLSFILKRPRCLVNTLALAALALLVINPLYLFDISFQLSFFVVFFLIYYAGFIRGSGNGPRRRITEFLLLTVSAFVFAAPLVAFYFQRFALLAIPLNLAGVPLAEFFILPWLFLGLFFSLLAPGLPNIFWYISSKAIPALTRLVTLSAGIQGVNSYILPPSISQLCLITALFLVLPHVKRNRHVRGLALAVAASLALVTCWKIYERGHGTELVFHMVDVGQGLSQVVEFPGGTVMVADAGGARSFDIGRAVVAPYLRRLGIKRIDILAVSHPEQDHIGGVPALLREFDVGQLWLNRDSNPGLPAYETTLRLAEKKRIPIHRWSSKRDVPVGPDAGVTVMPCRDCPESQSRNARCLVFRLNYMGRHILMPGDITAWREKRITAAQDVFSRVLVVPHHGSRTSSSPGFLKAVSPGVAVCSVGYKNSFHLPSRSILSRYEHMDIPFLRTDMDGTIDVHVSENRAIHVSSYLGGVHRK